MTSVRILRSQLRKVLEEYDNAIEWQVLHVTTFRECWNILQGAMVPIYLCHTVPLSGLVLSSSLPFYDSMHLIRR